MGEQILDMDVGLMCVGHLRQFWEAFLISLKE